MGKVSIRIKLLNVPLHWRARRHLYDKVHELMKGNGYLLRRDRCAVFPPTEYVAESGNDRRPACQIAAAIKAGINAIHTPTKVWVTKDLRGPVDVASRHENVTARNDRDCSAQLPIIARRLAVAYSSSRPGPAPPGRPDASFLTASTNRSPHSRQRGIPLCLEGMELLGERTTRLAKRIWEAFVRRRAQRPSNQVKGGMEASATGLVSGL